MQSTLLFNNIIIYALFIVFLKNNLKKINENLSPPIEIVNFLSKEEMVTFLEYMNTLKNNIVKLDVSIIIFFSFNDHEILSLEIKSLIREFYVNNFKPHFHISSYLLRIHADTGKNSNDIIFKNVLIPLEIKSINKSSVHTIVLKNK